MPLAVVRFPTDQTTFPAGSPARVTSLPVGVADGTEVHYVADAADGMLWRFRYNAAGGAYKWEFVGGRPLYAEVTTPQTRNVATYADLTTVGPSITCRCRAPISCRSARS